MRRGRALVPRVRGRAIPRARKPRENRL